MRVVVDTNTVVSALLWRGSPYRLFQAVNDDRISLYTSRVLLDEFEDVLSRRMLSVFGKDLVPTEGGTGKLGCREMYPRSQLCPSPFVNKSASRPTAACT